MTFYADLAYLLSAFLFLAGLKQLSSPATARRGNQMAALAMVLSAVLMLDWLGETEIAGRVRQAVSAVIADGGVRTYDMLKLRGGPQAIAQGAATTGQMTEAIVAALR